MRAIVVVIAALLVSTSGAARAQETGSSFGGGDWGDDDVGGGGSDFGGGGSDFGGGSDWGSGGGSDFGSGGGSDFGSGGGGGFGSGSSWGGSGGGYPSSSSGGSHSAGGGCSGGGRICCGSIGSLVFLGALFVFVATRRSMARARMLDEVNYGVGLLEVNRAPPVSRRPHAAPRAHGVDVSAISLAIDWRERKRLQTRLAALARSGDTKSIAGLTRLLHETVIELRRAQHAWLYAGAFNAQPSAKQEARATFTRIAQDMRSRYRRELLRANDGGTATDEAPALRASELEGPGVVVVTLVVAARGHIPDVANAQDGEHLRMLMRALGAIDASSLVALEVIWSPSAEDDRMSTVELEALYPELRKIDAGSLGGRVFCGYCGFPHPAELLRCPECGAPTAAASLAE